jgi:hypothetical protein
VSEPAAEQPCRWCGAPHGPLCPWVKALEFAVDMDGNERVTRVEFLTPRDYAPERKEADDPAAAYPKLGPGT